MGVVVAYLMFKVVLPEHTMGHRGHAAALWREAQAPAAPACTVSSAASTTACATCSAS
jgi:hypothetical protein